MKNIIPIFLMFFCLGACVQIYYNEPVPVDGEEVMEIPLFLDGKFLVVKDDEDEEEDELGFVSTMRRAEREVSRCMIYEYYRFPYDSLDNLLSYLESDSNNYAVNDTSIIVYDEDTSQFIKRGSYFESEETPVYELNLSDGFFINDYDDAKKLPSKLLKKGEIYFLNYQDYTFEEKKPWNLIRFMETESGISFFNSVIASESDSLQKSLDRLAAITELDSAGDDKFIISPDSEQFDQIMNEKGIFRGQDWIRIQEEEEFSIIWYGSVAIVIILFLIFAIRRFGK